MRGFAKIFHHSGGGVKLNPLWPCLFIILVIEQKMSYPSIYQHLQVFQIEIRSLVISQTMSRINCHGSFNKGESDALCESFAQINLKNGTNDPSHPSDKHHVNDMSGNKAYMNCYLTALVGNSGVYNRLGVKQFAIDFNIKVTNTKNLYEINDLYTGLGDEEGKIL